MMNEIAFTCPSSTVYLEEVEGMADLKGKLNGLRDMEGFDRTTVRYKLVQIKDYLYARCRQRGCRASLKYKKKEHGYILSSSCTQHLHRPQSSKPHIFKQVQEYMNSVPGTCQLSLKQAVCRSFNITAKQFYYISSLIKKKQDESFSDFIAKIEKQGFEVYISGQERGPNDLPRILIAVSPEMKKAYAKYGERVSFDLTFRLIKDQREDSTWKVGVFLGLSSTNRLVPFGIAITLNQTKDTYIQLFKMFFAAVGSQPKVIISDQQRAIHAALVQMQSQGDFSGSHLYDSFHILHNIFKKLGNKADIRFYSKILHAKNKAELSKHIKKAQEKLDCREGTTLWHFLKNQHMYCFASIQCHSLIGFTSSSSINQSFHALIKRVQRCEKDYVTALKNLIGCSQRLIQKSEQFQPELLEYQAIFKKPEIKGVRLFLTKSIFSHFASEFAEIIHLETADVVEDRVVVIEYGQTFFVRRHDGKWKCQCGYLEKCQLPCRHLLKVLIQEGESIIEHLPDRWRVKDTKSEEERMEKPLGRPRLSRRKVYY